MIEDTRRDWAVPGIIFGKQGNQIIICSTLDGVPYFPDDVPIPPVGQEDSIQPEYPIMLAAGEGVEREYTPLGTFFTKPAFDIFAEILGNTMKAMIGESKETGDETI